MEAFGLATGDQRLFVKRTEGGVIIQVWDEDRFCSIKLAEFQLEGLVKELKK